MPRRLLLASIHRASTMKAFTSAFLAGLGAVAGIVGLASGLLPNLAQRLGIPALIIAVALALGYGLWSAWPRASFGRDFELPATRVSIVIGDLFAQPGHLIIGMTDTFDTEPPVIISPNAVQAQFLAREYEGDLLRLDKNLRAALADRPTIASATREAKRLGKLERYAMGTVAVLGTQNHKRYCLAYSRMSDDCIAESSVTQIWNSLAALWPAVRATADLGVVSTTVLGMGLARLSGRITQDDMIRLIIISYLTASREMIVASHLQIVLPARSAENTDLMRLRRYLAAQ
jgi:Domain of unknown function (DUF6430)